MPVSEGITQPCEITLHFDIFRSVWFQVTVSFFPIRLLVGLDNRIHLIIIFINLTVQEWHENGK